MAFLNTLDVGQYSPTLCIRGGVNYCRQILSSKSGQVGQNIVVCNNRIHGNFNYQQEFECGYFNFEDYTPTTPGIAFVEKTFRSIDGVYSGIQTGPEPMPLVANFWKTTQSVTANQAIANTFNVRNVVVVSGYDIGNLNSNAVELYIPSSGNLLDGPNASDGVAFVPANGDITIYGRFKTTSRTNAADILLFGGASSVEYGNGLKLQGDKLRVYQQTYPDYNILEGTKNVTSTSTFYNFIFTGGTVSPNCRLYEAYDNQPFSLTAVGDNGYYRSWYSGIKLVSDLVYHVIWSDFGISNRHWSADDVREFDRTRLYPGYFIIQNPYAELPPPSGSDADYLQFHFPVLTSGNRGVIDSGNYTSTNYYIPLNSGLSDRLYEFDRSDLNSTALTVDMWVKSQGTNPSGYIGASVLFLNGSYWSGFPVQIPHNQISLVRMSGQVFDYLNNPSNLADIEPASVEFGETSKLGLGAWYKDIGTTYSGDINVYSARVYLDGYCIPQSTGNGITLYVSGEPVRTGSLDLYIQNSTVFDSCDLYIEGAEETNNSCTLFIAGDFCFKSTTLYIAGHEEVSSDITLYMDGGFSKAPMPLYIFSQPPEEMTGNIPLHLWATEHSGNANGISLFVGENAPSGQIGAGMNLYTLGPNSNSLTGNMNLFLRREYEQNTGSITMYCHNAFTGASGQLTLFMNAPSGTLGATPYAANMNLFIARSSEAIDNGIPLIINGPTETVDNTTLFINGGTPYFSSIPLVTNGIGITDTERLKLYINGF